MCLLALGAANLVGNLIGGAVSSNAADTERNRATERQRQINEKRKAAIKKATEAERRAELDLGNVYEGMTSISPETAYVRRVNEQASAAAIDKAIRSGTNSGEIMARVASILESTQNQSRAISAQEESRRQKAQLGAKGQKVRAAQVGARGERELIDVEETGRSRELQEHQLINQAANQNFQSFSNVLGDVTSLLGQAELFGGGIDPTTGMPVYGGGLKSEWGSVFGTQAQRSAKKASKKSPPKKPYVSREELDN